MTRPPWPTYTGSAADGSGRTTAADVSAVGDVMVSLRPPVDVTDDLRTLWIDYDSLGARFQSFEQAVDESTTVQLRDNPYQGAPTSLQACRRMVEEGGSAKGWFAEFCHDRKITRKDKVYHDMANLVEAVEAGATIDQVNIGGLVMMECLMRRLMSLTEAYDRGPEYPDWQLASFISAEYRRGDLMPTDFRSELSRKARRTA